MIRRTQIENLQPLFLPCKLHFLCAIATVNWAPFCIVSQTALNFGRYSKDIVFFRLFGARFVLSGSHFDKNYFCFTNVLECNILPYILDYYWLADLWSVNKKTFAWLVNNKFFVLEITYFIFKNCFYALFVRRIIILKTSRYFISFFVPPAVARRAL